MNVQDKIIKAILLDKDEAYRSFQGRLIPNIDDNKIIGVRIPKLRKICKELSDEEREEFIDILPHYYLEENLLHSIILSKLTDYNKIIQHINDFIDYIDCWAVCDTLSPVIKKENLGKFSIFVEDLLCSEKEYRIRFAIIMLMKYFLGDNFKEKYLKLVIDIKQKDYYVYMAKAWYFAEALYSQWDSTIVLLEKRSLYKELHRMTIRKAIESRKISEDKKKYLKELRNNYS